MPIPTPRPRSSRARTRAGCSRRARSTSPAAPWCTSTPASRRWWRRSWSARARAGVVCLLAATKLKAMLGYDDALDAFGVHCIGGIIGALGTGLYVNPKLGGTGVYDYVANKVGDFDAHAQFVSQMWAVGTSLV